MDFEEAYESEVTSQEVVNELKKHSIWDIIADGDTIIVNNGHAHDEFVMHGINGYFQAADLFNFLGY